MLVVDSDGKREAALVPLGPAIPVVCNKKILRLELSAALIDRSPTAGTGCRVLLAVWNCDYFECFHKGLTPKLSRIAARSRAHGKLILPCDWRSDAISA